MHYDDVAALQAKVSVAEEACMELQAQFMAAEARGDAATALQVEFKRVGFIVIVLPNLRHTATHCTTLHHTAPHCTTLHHTAIIYPVYGCRIFKRVGSIIIVFTSRRHTATHYITLQHTARHCTTHRFESFGSMVIVFKNLRHTAIHSNTLQRTAPHCNDLSYTWL